MSPPGPDDKQLEQVVAMLGNDLRMNVNSYTFSDSVARRSELRNEFASGDLQALVAIRCLDEGVDIPETRRAFILASSTNPRQSVQRRGRVLRKSEGKDRAEVFDFLVVPPMGRMSEEQFEVERRLVKRELIRAAEFAAVAENGPQAMASLGAIARKYNLIDIG